VAGCLQVITTRHARCLKADRSCAD
jgi:hypothetical protein